MRNGERQSAEGGAGIQLVRTPAGADAVAWLLESRHLWLVPGVFVVVPSRAEADRVTIALARTHGPFLGRSSVGTLADLARAALGHRVRESGSIVRSLAAQAAIDRASACADPSLPCISLQPATVSALVAEMEESGLGDESILSALSAWMRDASHPASRVLAATLAEVFTEHAAMCRQAGLVSPAALLRLAVAVWSAAVRPGPAGAASSPNSGTWCPGAVVCAGFLGFSSVQRLLLSTLARVCRVVVALPPEVAAGTPLIEREVKCWEEAGSEQLKGAERNLNLRPVASGWHDRMEPKEDAPFSAGASAGSPVATSAGSSATSACSFAARAGSPTGSPSLRLLQSAGRRGEMETVASEVVELMRQGFEPKDILLVARRVRSCGRVAEQIFAQSGIPLAVDEAVRLGDSGLGQALLALLGDLLEGRSQAVISYLGGRYSPTVPAELRGDELKKWRRILAWPRGDTVRPDLAELFPAAMDTLHSCLRVDGSGVQTFHLPSVVRLARSMFAASKAADPVHTARLGTDARALRALEAAICEMDEWESLNIAPFPAPGRILEILRDAPVWPVRPAAAVTLTSAHRLTTRRFRAVFVLGLVDQEFPEGERVSGLLSSSLKRECNRAGGVEVFSEPVEGQEEFLFHLAVSRARDVVYLSQRISEDDGNPVSPSPFLCFWKGDQAPVPWRSRSLADVIQTPGSAPGHREYLRSCAGLRLWPEEHRDQALLAGWMVPPRPSSLKDPRVRARLAARQTFPAGEIEQYRRCPLVWFLERQVGIEQPGAAGARQMGIITHAVLAVVYQAMMARGLLPLTTETQDTVQGLAGEALLQSGRSLDGEGPPGGRALMMAQVLFRLRDHLRREAKWAGHLRTLAVELALPDEGIDLGEGVRINGRIDRVDVSPSGDEFAVIDYKSGSFVPKRRWAEEGALQVPLYLLALAALWPHRQPLGGAYLALANGKAMGLFIEAARGAAGGNPPWRFVDESEMQVELDACRAAAAQAIEGMRSGRLSHCDPPDCPEYCHLGPVCRSRRAGKGGGR